MRLGGTKPLSEFRKTCKEISMRSYGSWMTQYLHQCLGDIASPLLEVPTLLKPSEARKKGCECNPVEGLDLFDDNGFDIPAINLIEDALGLRGPMCYLQVILNPHNEVVLERPLDGLMEKVRGEEFVNVRLWKLHREWLL